MRYKILKRIQNGQSTVGFQLLSEDKKVLNIPKDQVIHAAHQGLVINAVYNKNTKSISGTNGTDLRSLPVIQYSEILNSKSSNTSKNSNQPKQINNKHKTNHELAKEYILKQKTLGKNLIKVELLPNDKVKLLEVLDKESTGIFIFPSFITEHLITKIPNYEDTEGPFKGCRFEEVVINHDYLDWGSLFSGMNSKKLLINYQGRSIKNMNRTFERCFSLESICINKIDTSNVIDMSYIFHYCRSLKQLDLSSFNTSKVTDMKHMFDWCELLNQLDLSSFDTSSVTDMAYMFSYCMHLEQVDLSKFNTSKVTSMAGMFNKCGLLRQLNLSSFDTSNVTDMSFMFGGCWHNLQQLDLHNFDTSNVTNMKAMFYGCSSLKQLDLSSFNTSKVTDIQRMFSDCRSLEHVKVKNGNKIGRLPRSVIEVVKV